MLITLLGSYITHSLHEAAPTAPTDSPQSLTCRALSPPTPIPLLTPLSPPRHPLFPRLGPLPPAIEETVDSNRWEHTVSVISKDRIRKEMDDEFRLGVVARGKGSGPHQPGELRLETRATVSPGLLLASASSTVPPTLVSSASLPRYILGLVRAPPEPINTTGSWSHMGTNQYSSIYYVKLPILLPSNATQTLGESSQHGWPSAKGNLGVENDLWLNGSVENGRGETKARSAVYWRSANSCEGDEPLRLEQYDQLEAVEWEVVQDNQDGPPATFNTPSVSNPEPLTEALVIRQFASAFFDIIGSQLVPTAVQGV